VPKETTLTQISLPIIRYENLICRNHSERTRRTSKANKMKRKRIAGGLQSNETGCSGCQRHGRTGCHAIRSFASLQLLERRGIMSAANNGAKAGPEIDVTNRRVFW